MKLGFLDRELLRMVPKLGLLEMGVHLKRQPTTNGWLYFTSGRRQLGDRLPDARDGQPARRGLEPARARDLPNFAEGCERSRLRRVQARLPASDRAGPDAAGRGLLVTLDDPDGTPWVMQAYTTLVDPSLTYEGLKTLGDKLKLPKGWSYRVKVLDEGLTTKAVKGVAHIVQDDLQGTYDACKDGACNFQP